MTTELEQKILDKITKLEQNISSHKILSDEYINNLSDDQLEDLKHKINKKLKKSFINNLLSLSSLKIIIFAIILEFSIEVIVELLID